MAEFRLIPRSSSGYAVNLWRWLPQAARKVPEAFEASLLSLSRRGAR